VHLEKAVGPTKHTKDTKEKSLATNDRLAQKGNASHDLTFSHFVCFACFVGSNRRFQGEWRRLSFLPGREKIAVLVTISTMPSPKCPTSSRSRRLARRAEAEPKGAGHKRTRVFSETPNTCLAPDKSQGAGSKFASFPLTLALSPRRGESCRRRGIIRSLLCWPAPGVASPFPLNPPSHDTLPACRPGRIAWSCLSCGRGLSMLAKVSMFTIMSALEIIVEELKALPPGKLAAAADYIHQLKETSLAERRHALDRAFGCLTEGRSRDGSGHPGELRKDRCQPMVTCSSTLRSSSHTSGTMPLLDNTSGRAPRSFFPKPRSANFIVALTCPQTRPRLWQRFPTF